MFPVYAPYFRLVAAAIVPALLLLVMVYRMDKIEKEPIRLLASLVGRGIYATTFAKLIEQGGYYVMSNLLPEHFHANGQMTIVGNALLYLLLVGFAEEGTKYVLLKRRTWGIPDFNYRFDGVVYAVFVSLGFALWENVSYVLMYGMATAILRALTAVPGHACFGVFMGCWYANAYTCFRAGRQKESQRYRRLAVILPALLHGAYDFLAVMSDLGPSLYFLAFIIIMFIITFIMLKRLSARDAEIQSW